MHRFEHDQKRANPLKIKEIPQTQRFAGFPLFGPSGGI
uniref:Uncharacterized protein n=1 Tax=Siphoviridae sp. ctwfx1 TaxID=2825732 RepID=A0A8S5UVE2_9CAUD|nr:MAG TPA: hypothetical protein [Siphoviridae sp. ctwfx1]